MKLATGLQLLVGVSALALVLVFGIALSHHDSPLAFDVHRGDTHLETAIPASPERMTAIHFTLPSVGPFLIEDGTEIVWYSGFGGELVTWCRESPIGSRRYFLGGWEVWPDKLGRYPEESLIKSLRKATRPLQKSIMTDDVDRIVLGLPLSAPDSEVAARIARKEFRSIDHLFDWAAYAAQQKRRALVPNGPHATILAADESPSDRARRAATETVDIFQ